MKLKNQNLLIIPSICCRKSFNLKRMYIHRVFRTLILLQQAKVFESQYFKIPELYCPRDLACLCPGTAGVQASSTQLILKQIISSGSRLRFLENKLSNKP